MSWVATSSWLSCGHPDRWSDGWGPCGKEMSLEMNSNYWFQVNKWETRPIKTFHFVQNSAYLLSNSIIKKSFFFLCLVPLQWPSSNVSDFFFFSEVLICLNKPTLLADCLDTLLISLTYLGYSLCSSRNRRDIILTTNFKWSWWSGKITAMSLLYSFIIFVVLVS